MSLEIRPARAEEMEGFRHTVFDSLVLSPEIMPPEVVLGIDPGWTLCGFEDNTLATAYAAWPLSMQLNGTSALVAGITHVGTLPVYRGRGHLGKVIARHFEIMHEKGERSIAALYASRATIYQRYGYAVVSTRNRYSVSPEYLRTALPKLPEGTYREVKTEESKVISDIYKRFYEDRNGYIKRGKAIWLFSLLKPPSRPGVFLTTILYEEDVGPAGYMIYASEPSGSTLGAAKHQIHIRDLAWLTPSAYQAIWSYFSRLRLAEQIRWDVVPPDDPLPHLLLEPRMLNLNSADGMLARIVDIDKAMIQRPYQGQGELTFDIRDDLCPWNTNRWRLETSGAQSRIQITEASPDVAMPISTLAMLFFGQINASQAARMGRLHVYEEAALSKWDTLFSTKYRPFCADFF